MNNKGFAITGIIYGLMVVFVFILSSFLAVVVGKNKRSEELTKSVYDSIKVNVKKVYSFNSTLSDEETFDKVSHTYTTKERAKYVFYNDGDTTVCGEVYLPKETEVKVKSDGLGLEYTVNGRTESLADGCSYSMGSETEEPTEPEEPSVTPSTPNSPDLVDGLIPVMYDESKNKWVVADKSNTNETYKWYDYDNKQWANAVLVTDDKRKDLINTADRFVVGEEVGDSEADGVLAFYVWIPRYQYKVWNINKQAGTNLCDAYNTGISIKFEKEKESTGTITCSYDYNVGEIGFNKTLAETCKGNNDEGKEIKDTFSNSNGEYYTHPAFCLGETTDGVCSGDTLRGFWIGKFELSSSSPSERNHGGGEETGLDPRVLPNVTSWRYNNLANYNTVIQNMTKTKNDYGLDADETSSHILTNMEWGAVAYLTNSKYGRCSVDSNGNTTCKEVTINNCGSYITGVGADNNILNSVSSTTCTTAANMYDGVKGMKASTTGNIYGVYDMSGGAWEYVMGSVSSVSGAYTFYPESSDFPNDPNDWYNTNEKFLTKYAYTSSHWEQTDYNKARLGDATAEVLLTVSKGQGGWYNDYAYFPCSNLTGNCAFWFSRGGDANVGNYAGIFSYLHLTGGAYDTYDVSTRSALAKVS